MIDDDNINDRVRKLQHRARVLRFQADQLLRIKRDLYDRDRAVSVIVCPLCDRTLRECECVWRRPNMREGN